MNKEEIDDIVCLIMRYDGPDRHEDGHEIITDFIISLLDGNSEEWNRKYVDGEIYDTHFYWEKQK